MPYFIINLTHLPYGWCVGKLKKLSPNQIIFNNKLIKPVLNILEFLTCFKLHKYINYSYFKYILPFLYKRKNHSETLLCTLRKLAKGTKTNTCNIVFESQIVTGKTQF